MCFGVGRSGSPIPRLMTSTPGLRDLTLQTVEFSEKIGRQQTQPRSNLDLHLTS